MILYHGTDSYAAEEIQREGLKPAVHPFHLDCPTVNSELSDPGNTVYLTPEWFWAKQFALLRAAYVSAAPGSAVEAGEWKRMIKYDSFVRPNALPVVIEFDIPETMTGIETDPQSWSMDGRMYAGTIPASYIKHVHTLKTREKAA